MWTGQELKKRGDNFKPEMKASPFSNPKLIMIESLKKLPREVLEHIVEYRGYKKVEKDKEVWIGCPEFKNGTFLEWSTIWHGGSYCLVFGGQYVSREETWKDGLRHGAFKMYNKDGRLTEMIHYVDGKKQGMFTKYYTNGVKASECNMELGRRHGAFKIYNMNGRLIDNIHYVDGKKHGMFTRYHPNGVKARECNIELGRRHGLQTRWDEAGNVVEYISFVEGVPQWTERPNRSERFRS